MEFSAFIFKNDVLQTEPVVFPITEEKDFFEGNPIVIARYYSKSEIDDEHNLTIKNEMTRLRNNYILIYGENADDENSPDKKFSFGLTITDSAKIFQKNGDAGVEYGNKNITNTYLDSVFLINPHKNLKDAENSNIQTQELTEENLGNDESENLQIVNENDDGNDKNEIQNDSKNTDKDENLRNIDAVVENDKSEFSITQDEIEIAKSAELSTEISDTTEDELLKISKIYPHIEENTFYISPVQSDDVTMSSTARKGKAFLITIVVIIFIVIFLFFINHIIDERKYLSSNRNLYYGSVQKLVNKKINDSVGCAVGKVQERYLSSSAISLGMYVLGLILLLIPNSITRDIAFIVFLLSLLRTIFNILKLIIKALFSFGNDFKKNDFNIKKFIGEKIENKCPKILQFLLHDFIGSVLNIILSSPLNLIKYLFTRYTKDCLIIIGTFLINVVCISILLKTLLVNAVEIDLTFSERLWYPIKHLFQTIFS